MSEEPIKTKIAFVSAGAADSGKSTFNGVITDKDGEFDDGDGKIRNKNARHQHEIDSRHTSSITVSVFDTKKGHGVTFIDLCGQEKYLKTTVKGILKHRPDYGFLIVSPQNSVTPLTIQHFKILTDLNIPIVIVITRADATLRHKYITTRKAIKQLCKVDGGGKRVEFVNSLLDYKNYSHLNGREEKDMEEYVKKFKYKTLEEMEEKKMEDKDKIIENLESNRFGQQNLIPVVTVSNVTGFYIDVMKQVFGEIFPRDIWNQNSKNNGLVKLLQESVGLKDEDIDRTFSGTIFHIDHCFQVEGVGTVVSGMVQGDPIKPGDTLYIGPYNKQYAQVKIRTIRNNNNQNVTELSDHCRGCCALGSFKKAPFEINRKTIGRGKVLLTKENLDRQAFRFSAALKVFGSQSLLIGPRYSPMINMGVAGQAAHVEDQKDGTFKEITTKKGTKMYAAVIGTGSINKINFKFTDHEEIVLPGTLFTFRSGNVQGVGMVIDVLPVSKDEHAFRSITRKEKRLLKKSGAVKLKNEKKAETFKKVNLAGLM